MYSLQFFCILAISTTEYVVGRFRPNDYQQMLQQGRVLNNRAPVFRAIQQPAFSPALNQPSSFFGAADPNEDGCDFLPNGTMVQPAFYQCAESSVITLHGGAITNLTGDDSYPITFSEPIRVFLDITSHAKRRYDNLGVDVSIYKRSSGWFRCGWMFLPSFGQLSNVDVCNDNPSCPVSPGRQVLEFTIDPHALFTRLFRMIHDDMTAYQMVIRLVDNRRPYDYLLCTTIQMRIRL